MNQNTYMIFLGFPGYGSSSSDDRPSQPGATSTPIVSIPRTTTSATDAAKIASLESKISDLELLNSECLSVIRNLQKDVEERSKKILKLELAGNRAKIVTHREKPMLIETSGPKIEMTSLVSSKSSSSSSVTSSKSSSTDLDLVK
jgi:hypothetical protein